MEKIINCLLVDDDIDDRDIFLMVLESLGDHIQYLAASNGAEALDMLENDTYTTPDVIFLDVNMPKMNGIETLKKIRLNDKLNNCRIFMYSTTSEPRILEESKKFNAGFIVKPIRTVDLEKMLQEILV